MSDTKKRTASRETLEKRAYAALVDARAEEAKKLRKAMDAAREHAEAKQAREAAEAAHAQLARATTQESE